MPHSVAFPATVGRT